MRSGYYCEMVERPLEVAILRGYDIRIGSNPENATGTLFWRPGNSNPVHPWHRAAVNRERFRLNAGIYLYLVHIAYFLIK